jgi:hypothetical protein
MQQDPPDSPGVVETLRKARRNLEQSFRTKFTAELYTDTTLGESDFARLSVGPLTEDFREFCRLCKFLYAWLVEFMVVSSLRTTLQSMSADVDSSWRQIRLLDAVVSSCSGSIDEGKRTTDPLRGLNALRVVDAHIAKTDWDAAFKLLGLPRTPPSLRAAWQHCVDSVAVSLDSASARIRAALV